MGYYSTVNIYSFHVEDVEKAKELFKKYKENDPDGYFFYELEVLNSENRQVTAVPEDNNYTAKHYADRRLAEAISKIIVPNETVDLTFDGEDGTKWGYRISRNKVLPLTCEFLTQDEQHLFNICKKRDIESLKYVLRDYINRMSFDPEEFAEAMEDLHPTLQQNLMRLFISWCHKQAQRPLGDARNDESIKLAREIVKSVADYYNYYLPLI